MNHIEHAALAILSELGFYALTLAFTELMIPREMVLGNYRQ